MARRRSINLPRVHLLRVFHVVSAQIFLVGATLAVKAGMKKRSAAAELNRAEEGEAAPKLVPLRGLPFAEEVGDGDEGGLPNAPDLLTFSLTEPRGLLREGRELPALLPLLDGEPRLFRR